MTPHERDLTPEEEDEVSRLLAEMGGPAEPPPEIVARLDDVLAGLVAERGSAPVASTVAEPAGSSATPAISLDAERRRRRWPQALLAAAAVVVAGYGVGAALIDDLTSGGGDDAATSAGAGADAEAGGSSAESQSAGGGAGEGGAAGDAGVPAPANASVLGGGPPQLDPDRLAQDVAGVLAKDAERARPGKRSTYVLRDPVDGALLGCLPPSLGPDDAWYLVRYDGRRAALVAAPPEGGTVRASVVGCDGEQLATVTVPAP